MQRKTQSLPYSVSKKQKTSKTPSDPPHFDASTHAHSEEGMEKSAMEDEEAKIGKGRRLEREEEEEDA